MIDFGLIEDKRHSKDAMDAQWSDDETLQLKLDFEDAYHLWTARRTKSSSERCHNLHRNHLHSKWEEKIKLCNNLEISAVKRKFSKDNKAACRKLLNTLKYDESRNPTSSS
ncbi:unnamed protein product [Trichobilharzia szidati]|nr:unnamed protein product [Trichobilharzia szidati]